VVINARRDVPANLKAGPGGFLRSGERRSRSSDPAFLHDGRVQILKGVEELLSSGLFGRRTLGNVGEIGDCLEGVFRVIVP
jgi:hypothetical protein